MHDAQQIFLKINSERNEIIQKENDEKAANERAAHEKEQAEIAKIPDNTPEWKKKQLAEERDKKRKVEHERDSKKYRVIFLFLFERLHVFFFLFFELSRKLRIRERWLWRKKQPKVRLIWNKLEKLPR